MKIRHPSNIVQGEICRARTGLAALPTLVVVCLVAALAAAQDVPARPAGDGSTATKKFVSEIESEAAKASEEVGRRDAATIITDPTGLSDEEAAKRDAVKLAQDEAAQETPHFVPIESRWYEPPLPWALMPGPIYELNEPGVWYDPYRQNPIKGDYPLFGTDVFLQLTLTNRTVVEGRVIPTGSGITGPDTSNQSFFGDSEQLVITSKSAISIDIFKGQQAFKPVDWRIKFTPVFDVTSVNLEELGGININVKDGKSRLTGDVALQEALVEIHLADLSDRFDFLSSEFGILPFRSDFRGFIFDDVNLGVRLFGNYDNNLWQYNLVVFNMLEKDTYSELNTLEERDQQVVIANVYRQDPFGLLGYTTSFSFHYNHDEPTTHFDRADFLVRPAPVGLAREKEIDAFYLGWAGEGHFGRFNVTHAFYQVFGEDQNNSFATRDVDINAQFAALEVSYDIDWARVRLYGMYASGDDDTTDGDGEGFDAILEGANFAGGDFSFWGRQNIKLLGVGLVQRQSFLPDLTTSKLEGQANFVNPGLLLVGAAFDAEITPEWRGQIGVNYMHFAETDPLEIFLETEDIPEEIGTEVYIGTTYRPFLHNHVIITFGGSMFIPGDGFEKIYQTSEVQWQAFLDLILTY